MSNYLIHIHIRLGAAACLPYYKRKMIIQLAADNLISSKDNSILLTLSQLAQLVIADRCTFLENSKGLNDLNRHFLRTNREVLLTALCLRSPESICRDLNLTNRIFLNPVLHVYSSLKYVMS
ncbi:hypothetical protein D1872_232190 [compost metagenome]